MRLITQILIPLLLFITTKAAFGISVYTFGNDKTPPTWSSSYTLTGTLYLPYAEIAEPFIIWYDSKAVKSRIDYYGGMVKTYQLPKVFDYGTSIKIAPITTESQLNVETCLQVNGTEQTSIAIQSVLPALDGFKLIGGEVKNGLNTEKWQLVDNIQTKINTYTMWLTYDREIQKSSQVAIPVRYEMKGFDSLLGSHYDHYYLDYENFDDTPIDPDVFLIKSNTSCVPFPGPGAMHIATFNPMNEFIYPTTTAHIDLEFDKFKTKHSKQYINNIEHQKRKHVFMQNLRFIHIVNRQHKGYSTGVNHLADRTKDELKVLRGRVYSGVYNGGTEFPYKKIDSSSFPSQYDWRLYGAVTPVKDQAVCGSCWSFGTVGAIEGAYFLKSGGQLLRFSEQALIDCSWGYGNNGCDGGEDFRSYQWMMKHGGIPTYDDYGTYLGSDGFCHVDSVPLYAKLTGYVNVTSNNPKALKLAMLKHGPISVAIDASHRSLSFYSHGVYFEEHCGNRDDQLDHAVLAVGFGTMNGQDYWIVKNSWSNYWGNDGYVLMAAKDNNCGVMTNPTYVTM